MQHGGDKILKELNEDSVSSNESEGPPLVRGLAQVKEESISEHNFNPVENHNDDDGELFGPMSSQAIEQARNKNKVVI